MIGFVVPFKSRSRSNNWEKDNNLLRQTLQSICNQQSRNFRVYVVYTDIPLFEINDTNISYILYPFPFLTASEIEDYNDFLIKHFSDSMGEFMMDQGKRILYGCDHAIKKGCTFLMSVDADDLISNKITGYVDLNKDEKYGWFLNSGYIMRERSHFLIKVKNNMNFLNGSTNIVNANLVPTVDFESKNLADFSFFSSHGYLPARIKYLYSETLKPLPFYGLIYFVHMDNHSSLGSKLKKDIIKTMLKYIFFGKILTSPLRKEFGLNTFKIK